MPKVNKNITKWTISSPPVKIAKSKRAKKTQSDSNPNKKAPSSRRKEQKANKCAELTNVLRVSAILGAPNASDNNKQVAPFTANHTSQKQEEQYTNTDLALCTTPLQQSNQKQFLNAAFFAQCLDSTWLQTGSKPISGNNRTCQSTTIMASQKVTQQTKQVSDEDTHRAALDVQSTDQLSPPQSPVLNSNGGPLALAKTNQVGAHSVESDLNGIGSNPQFPTSNPNKPKPMDTSPEPQLIDLTESRVPPPNTIIIEGICGASCPSHWGNQLTAYSDGTIKAATVPIEQLGDYSAAFGNAQFLRSQCKLNISTNLSYNQEKTVSPALSTVRQASVEKYPIHRESTNRKQIIGRTNENTQNKPPASTPSGPKRVATIQDEEGFTLVNKKKTAHKRFVAVATAPTQINNSFQQLENMDLGEASGSIDTIINENSAISSNAPDATTNRAYNVQPPIIVTQKPSDDLFQTIAQTGTNYQIRITSLGVKFCPLTFEDSQLIQGALNKSNMHWFTHSGGSQGKFISILRGLPHMDPFLVKEELTAKGYEPNTVTLLPSRKSSPPYRVEWQKGHMNLALVNTICSIQRIRVWWEKPAPKPAGPAVCIRCCMFGHGSSFCHRQPVCAHCANNHLATDCRIDFNEGDNIQCCINCLNQNMQSDHSALDPKCPSRSLYAIGKKQLGKKGGRKKTTVTTNPERASSRSQSPRRQHSVGSAGESSAHSGRYVASVGPYQGQKLLKNVSFADVTSGHISPNDDPNFPPIGMRQFRRTQQQQPNNDFITNHTAYNNKQHSNTHYSPNAYGSSSDMPQPSNDADLYSTTELFALFKDLLPRFRQCKDKADQIELLAELLQKCI